MFFANLIVFSSLIGNNNFQFILNNGYSNQLLKINNNIKKSSSFEINKIGIIDFRFILKKSNAMKILGNKFLTLEKEINKKIKQKQIFFKQKEDILKKSKSKLTELLVLGQVLPLLLIPTEPLPDIVMAGISDGFACQLLKRQHRNLQAF